MMDRLKTFTLFLLLNYFLVQCEKPPHIIMIVADDLGFNDVSFHGSTQIPTPNIDKLAHDGVILNNYYVLPICTPTRSAIMTGRYPIHTGMQTGTIYAASPWGLGLNELLLPQYLKKMGYKTHAIGKWHLGFQSKEYTPTYRGFDTFYGYYGGQADYWDHSLNSNGYWGLDLHNDTATTSKTVTDQWGNYSSFMYAMEAIDRLQHHNQTDPMFLYLAFQAVHSANYHDPLEAPADWISKFNHIKHEGRRKYAAMVAYMDHSIGLVIKTLKKIGMLDESIIIFTSDNGGPANGLDYNWATNYPLRGVKTNVYEGGVRAAGLIYSKLVKNPKRVSLDMMHATDWLPTLLSAAGDDPINLTNLDGFNLWPTLRDASPSPRNEILLNIDPKLYKNAALRIGDWKLVEQNQFHDGWYPPPQDFLDANTTESAYSERNSDFKDATVHCGPQPAVISHCGGEGYLPCLFNIIEDPCEFYDLSKKYPLIYKQMQDRLQQYRDNMSEPKFTLYTDPRANPKLHNGSWLPWITL